MKVWVACFATLFVLAELCLWIKEILLPLPIYVLGGAFLAIASNTEGRFNPGKAVSAMPASLGGVLKLVQSAQPAMTSVEIEESAVETK